MKNEPKQTHTITGTIVDETIIADSVDDAKTMFEQLLEKHIQKLPAKCERIVLAVGGFVKTGRHPILPDLD